jgi:RNA polymerase sigma-70 factor (sigma-E family)
MPDAHEQAFRDFVAARWPSLLRTATLLTGDSHRAEDLVQTALAKLWLRWGRIGHDAPDAYVRRILVTTSTSWWRRRWRGEQPMSDAMPEKAIVVDFTERVAMHQGLTAALAELSPRQRVVVVLRYADDLPEAQVAELLGVSTGTVKTLASRGLAKLRDVVGVDEEVAL